MLVGRATKIPDQTTHILVIWLSLAGADAAAAAAPTELLNPPLLYSFPLPTSGRHSILFSVHCCFGCSFGSRRSTRGGERLDDQPTGRLSARRTCKSFVWVSLHFCHVSLPRYGPIFVCESPTARNILSLLPSYIIFWNIYL